MDDLIAYTRLPRRLKALLIDCVFLSIIFLVIIFLVKQLDLSVETVESLIILGLLVSVEPLCVWLTGGSVGHHLSALRVRRVAEDKRLGMLASYVRFFTKLPLGIMSLVTVMTSAKYQAVHDMISGSIVVHRSPKTVSAYEVLAERREDTERYFYPPKMRRVVFILLYLVLLVIAEALLMVYALSYSCIEFVQCSTTDTLSYTAVNTGFWIALFCIASYGWRCRLFGCRRKLRVK